MRYIDRVLQQGETVRHTATISWVSYLPGLLMWALAGVLAAVLPQSPTARTLLLVIAVVVFLVGAVFLVRAWWRRYTTESPSPIGGSFTSAGLFGATR